MKLSKMTFIQIQKLDILAIRLNDFFNKHYYHTWCKNHRIKIKSPYIIFTLLFGTLFIHEASPFFDDAENCYFY